MRNKSQPADKFLSLHASFLSLKSELAKVGISDIDTAGVMSGEGKTFVKIFKQLLFRRSDLSSYHVSPGLGDAKYVEGVYRYLRAELRIIPKLSVDQFLQTGAFAQRKIEFIAEVAKAILATSNHKTNDVSPSSSVKSISYTPSLEAPPIISKTTNSFSEESLLQSPPRPVSPGPQSTISQKTWELVLQLGRKLELVAGAVDRMDARLAILEHRLSREDKLRVGGGG